MLSGYLISGLLFAEYRERGTIDLRRFWIRRGLKIWPGLYIFLLLVAPLLNSSGQMSSFRAAALFYANYFDCSPLIGHTWSLAVEEHFYLLLPLLLVGLLRVNRLHWIPTIGISLLAICMVCRAFSGQGEAWHETQCRADALFVGVVLRYWREFDFAKFAFIGRTRNLYLASGLLSALFLSDRRMTIYGFACLSLAFAIILAWAVERRPNRLLKPLAAVGVYSYSIYLWQQLFTGAFKLHPSIGRFLIVVPIAILWGIMMAKVIEFPVLKFRDRVFPRTRCHVSMNRVMSPFPEKGQC